MQHKGTVTLETERLILRRFELSDAEAAFRNFTSDPEVTKFLTWNAHNNVSVTKAAFEDKVSRYVNANFYEWVIELKSIGEPIGSICIIDLNEDTSAVEFAYWIGSKWWHNGYTSESLASVISFFFEQAGANRIYAAHDMQNPHSGAVMRKCGMFFEGIHRQDGKNNQGICDQAEYAILAEDYFNKST